MRDFQTLKPFSYAVMHIWSSPNLEGSWMRKQIYIYICTLPCSSCKNKFVIYIVINHLNLTNLPFPFLCFPYSYFPLNLVLSCPSKLLWKSPSLSIAEPLGVVGILGPLEMCYALWNMRIFLLPSY